MHETKQKYSIGIVLPEVPGYSETFFYTKIRGLVEYGHNVILFVNSKSRPFDLCRVVKAPNVQSDRPLFLVLNIIKILIKLSFAAPASVKAFINLERKDGKSLREIIENIYINSHILPHKLDWLHFGFTTMAVRRENVARAINARMAISFRGYDISIYPIKNVGCYDKLWPKIDKVHTISDDLYNEAIELGLSTDIPMQKITPAINAKKFLTGKIHTGFQEPIKIITVGRLNWKKGLEYALSALYLLHKKGINFIYNIVGTGPELERLSFAAYQLGIKEKVNFLGKKSHDEVVTCLAESDIYLQPSLQEGFCNAVLEAQAAGLFCIVSDAEGLPENVIHGKTGWVVPKRNTEALSEKIEEVLNEDPVILRNLQAHAVERVKSQFNIEKQIQEFINFYIY